MGKTVIGLNAKEFGQFVQKERTKQEILQEKLGEGIYSLKMISKIETGKFFPERELRERLLERLGESAYDYETYIDVEDYKKWSIQNSLMDALDSKEVTRAELLLEKYEKKYKEKNIITKQFYLVMLLQLLELKKNLEEKGNLLEQAVKLTISSILPKPEESSTSSKLPIPSKKITNLILSITELNLVLEYITYQNPDNLKEQYQQLFQYIEQERFDLESQALFYSKLAFYFCRYQMEQLKQCKEEIETIQLAEELLEVCTEGLERLRNHKKIYFAWELLQIKQEILTVLLKEKVLFSPKRKENYQKELEQTQAFFEVIDRLYETYHVKKQTNEYTIFYRKREIYCINDVIRARRKMFRVQIQDLEDICEINTIKRIEKKASKIQIGLAQRLFQRFYLSMEMTRSLIVTSNQEAIWLEQKLRVTMNQREYEKAKELLRKLKEKISMEETINKQYIEYQKIKIVYGIKEIEKEEFIQRAIRILEYTMPLEVALRPYRIIKFSNGRTQQEEKYFTNMEVTILYNIARELEGKEKERYFSILKEYFEKLEEEKGMISILGMYGLVMTEIASDMGNQEQYEASTEINRKIVEQSLKAKHLEYVEENVYSLMWNEEKRKGLPEKENLERILYMQDCIIMDIYNKDKLNENWMKNKLKDILSI